MSNETDIQSARLPIPIVVGLILSLLVLGTAACVGLGTVCNSSGACDARWRVLASAPANEVGDTLSGIGSVLAFIWLVMTAWMQSMELREQRKELRAQRDEWAKMSRALDAQAAIFEDEKRSRKEAATDVEVDAIVELFCYRADRFFASVSVRGASIFEDRPTPGPIYVIGTSGGAPKDAFRRIIESLGGLSRRAAIYVEGGPHHAELARLSGFLIDILDKRDATSAAMNAFLSDLPLEQSLEVMEKLMCNPDLGD